MAYRFVHAADIHLDSPLRSLALRDPALAELIGGATRQAFLSVVDLCLNEGVDALILAGDLYDGEQTSMKTARFLADQLKRLQDGGVRAFIIRGNHDALSKITRELSLPDGAKVFGGRADAVTDRTGGFDVVIHGMSFTQPHAPDSLLPRHRHPVEGAVNIGLMHTSLDGSPSHNPYAPCAARDLAASGFTYWALGHLHGRTVAEGRCTLVMPGMPQGRDIGESGPKSVTLVTVNDDRSVVVEERLTSVAQFERVAVDLTGATEWAEALARINGALERCRDRVASPHLVARLILSGLTPLAWRIRRDADLLRAEAEQRATAIGRTWIDKLEIRVAMPTEAAGSGAAALGELRRLMVDEVRTSPSFLATLAGLCDELRGHLPPECRHVIGDDEVALAATLGRLAEEGSETVLSRLQSRGDGDG